MKRKLVCGVSLFICILLFWALFLSPKSSTREAFLACSPQELAIHMNCTFFRFPIIVNHSHGVTALIQFGCITDASKPLARPILLKADYDMPNTGEAVVSLQPQIIGRAENGDLECITIICVQLWAGGRTFGEARQILPGYLAPGRFKFKRQEPLVHAIQLQPDMQIKSSNEKNGCLLRIVTSSKLATQFSEAAFSTKDIESLLEMAEPAR